MTIKKKKKKVVGSGLFGLSIDKRWDRRRRHKHTTQDHEPANQSNSLPVECYNSLESLIEPTIF